MNRTDSFLVLAGVALAGASSATASQAATFATSIQPETPGVDSLITSMIWGWAATTATAVALGLAGGYRAIRSGVLWQPLILAYFLLYSLTVQVDNVSLGWPWQIHAGLRTGRIGLGVNLVGVALLIWYCKACRRHGDEPLVPLADRPDASEEPSPPTP